MKKLAQRQIEKKLASLESFKKSSAGIPSWIRYMRKAQNMTPKQLASRMKISLPSLYQLERKEAEDRANLQSLKRAAEAMQCELVYAFVPKQPLGELLEQQAFKRAKEVVLSANLQMEYEDQAVSKDELRQQVEDLAEEIKHSKNLWKEK